MTTTQNTTDNEPGEALEPVLVDRNAVLDAVALFCANFDTLGERFKKQLRNAIRAVPRAPLAAVEGDAHNRAVRLVDSWAIDRKLAPPQRYPVQQDFRILKEWIARALTDYAAASSSAPAEPPHDPQDVEREQAFREMWAENEKARPFDPNHPENYDTFTKRYAPPAEPPTSEGEQK